MACFTKTQQRNRTNFEFEKYVTTSNFFVLNPLTKSHLNSVCAEYVCEKSENARVCAKWQWKTLDWCYWIALPASPVVQSSNTVSCVSLSFRTHPCILAIQFPPKYYIRILIVESKWWYGVTRHWYWFDVWVNTEPFIGPFWGPFFY